jgi:4-diphosphocytidyl-2-C-methyl-D-erythritol kinase
LKLTKHDLMQLAARLGSDIAFFLEKSAAWCTGRGEIVEPLPLGAELHLLLVRPPSGCSTAEVYRRVKHLKRPQDGAELKRAAIRGALDGIAKNLFNRLQNPAFELNEEVAILYESLRRTSALGRLMSGSGSSLFALARDAEHARELSEELKLLPVPIGTQKWLTKSHVSGQDHTKLTPP